MPAAAESAHLSERHDEVGKEFSRPADQGEIERHLKALRLADALEDEAVVRNLELRK